MQSINRESSSKEKLTDKENKQVNRAIPNLEVFYEYADEDTGCNCGRGVLPNIEVLENSSREAYELSFELQPDYKQYYRLVDGNYEYYEEEDED